MAKVNDVELPEALVAAVGNQSAVLFLGAGASFDAVHPTGATIPGAEELKKELADKFLGGRLKHRNLSHVAEMCISETDLLTFQSFIRERFLAFEPAEHHLIIPKFYWLGIVTTNCDLIVEKAYNKVDNCKQEICVFMKDGQKIDTELKSKLNGVPYLKLHGSIDRIDDTDIPIILSTEQYVRYTEHRRRLFSQFQNLGYEFTIIFCGYSINDPHIQTILFDLCDSGINRPRYYLIDPDLDDVEIRYWASHRITSITATFSEFLLSLEREIPEVRRALPVAIGGGSETVRTFYKVSAASESDVLKEFLSNDAEHVRPGMATAGTKPHQFYTGYDTGWGPIEADLDVRRRVTDNIIVDAILTDETERRSCVDIHVIRGPAGQGKSTTLRRVAWEAAAHFSKICVFIREGGNIRTEALRELNDLVQDRIFLFVDHAALWTDEIASTVRTFLEAELPITVVTAERDNEWNVRCAVLDEFVAQEYPLTSLSEKEIHILLAKLQEHKALGRLTDYSYKERVSEFVDRADRQLLVALHEATLGTPFEEIVRDEFDRIIPAEAQTLYLDVCTLNRLGVPVRAGLISRVSGIRFEDFQDGFVKPLEHVVKSHVDRYVGDRMYSARHPHIADLVFQLALIDPEERFDQVIRILDGINIDYSSDNEAFRSLTRGKSVAEIFVSQELARKFYDNAERIVSNDPYLLQQRAIFEMNHPGGNLQRAESSLLVARDLAPYDKSIRHSLGNLKRRQANDAANPLERERLRRDARGYLADLTRANSRTSHGFHTMAVLLTDELRELLLNRDRDDLEPFEEKRVVELVRDIEAQIRQGQQQFPEEERLLTAEADFRGLLDQNLMALEALRKAFERNPRSEWVAIRLAHYHSDKGASEEAKAVLLRCVKENPSSKSANFALAKMYLRAGTEAEKKQMLQLLRRSFTDGDTHFDAQFWYARELFLNGELEKARILFSEMRHAPVSPSIRSRVRGLVRDEHGNVRRFRGAVSKKEEAYLFAKCEGFPTDAFCHVSQASEDVWGELTVGKSVEVEIGFSMRGPAAAAIFPT